MSLIKLGQGMSVSINKITMPNLAISVLAMGAGQSLIDRMDEVAFVNACPDGSLYGDGAVGGTPLTRTAGDVTSDPYWVDDSLAPTYSDGALLTSYLSIVDSGYSSRTDVNVVIWQCWNAERYRVTSDGSGVGNMNASEYSASFDYLVSRWREEHGTDVKIIIGLPHRRTSYVDEEIYGGQKLRQIYADKIDNDPNIFGVEHCDIDLVDATHHTVSGETEFGIRMGNMANHALNGAAKPDYPVLLSATIDYNNVICVFDSDITAPSAGVGQCVGESGGEEKLGNSLIRTANNTALFTLGDNQGVRIDDSPAMRIGSGVNHTLATTNADTLNNGSGTLPARGAYIGITDGNAITSIPDVKLFVDAKYSTKTYSSGADVSSLEGVKGAGLSVHPNVTNTDPIYDASLFGGRGGFKDNLGSACMQNIDGIAGGSTKTIFGVVDIPASITGVRIFTFGMKDGSADQDCSFFATASGFKWAKDQGSGYPTIFPGTHTGSNAFCLRFNSNGSLDCYLNSGTVGVSLDPRDDFSFYDTMHLFARAGQTDGIQGLGIGAFGAADVALTDEEISIIMSELGFEFGVTVS